jgi:hypothetical protein
VVKDKRAYHLSSHQQKKSRGTNLGNQDDAEPDKNCTKNAASESL